MNSRELFKIARDPLSDVLDLVDVWVVAYTTNHWPRGLWGLLWDHPNAVEELRLDLLRAWARSADWSGITAIGASRRVRALPMDERVRLWTMAIDDQQGDPANPAVLARLMGIPDHLRAVYALGQSADERPFW